MHFFPDLLQEIFRFEMPDFLKSAAVPSNNNKAISHSVMDRFVESLLFYFDNPDFITEEILRLKIKELILLLVQTNHAPSIKDLLYSIFSRKTVSAGDVVNAHLFDNLSIAELAKLAGMSLTSFKLECRKLFHESPGRYIRRKKMERAVELLNVNGDTISEIAYKIGFSDQSHFTKTFQAIYNCSPTTFRKRTER